MTYNVHEYEESVERYLFSYDSYEKGTASQQVADWMKNIIA